LQKVGYPPLGINPGKSDIIWALIQQFGSKFVVKTFFEDTS